MIEKKILNRIDTNEEKRNENRYVHQKKQNPMLPDENVPIISKCKNTRNANSKNQSKYKIDSKNHDGIIKMLQNIQKENRKSRNPKNYEPRPVMIKTTQLEIITHMERAKLGHNIIHKGMIHSLRFWLAVECNKLLHRKAAILAEYFDIEVSALKRASHDKLTAEQFSFLSPGEAKNTSCKAIIKTFGRTQDKVKFNCMN